MASTEDPIQPQKVKRSHRRKPTTSKTLPLCQTITQKPILKRKRASKQAEQSKKASGSSEWPKPSEFLNDAVEYYNKNGNLTGFLDSNNGKKLPQYLYIQTNEGRSSLRLRFQKFDVSNGSNDGLILFLSFLIYLMNPTSLNPDIISQLIDNLNREEIHSTFERLESFRDKALQNEKMKTKSYDWIEALRKTKELFRIEEDRLKPSLKGLLDKVVEYYNKNGNLTGFLDSNKEKKVPRNVNIETKEGRSYLRFRFPEFDVSNGSNNGLILLLSFATYLTNPASLNPDIISPLIDNLNKKELNLICERLESFCHQALQKEKMNIESYDWRGALEKIKELFRIEQVKLKPSLKGLLNEVVKYRKKMETLQTSWLQSLGHFLITWV